MKDWQYNGQKKTVKCRGLGLWCLMPLSTIFQLCRGGEMEKQRSTQYYTEN